MSKLRFDVVSLFPEAFKNFFNHGLIKKAFEEKIASIHNIILVTMLWIIIEKLMMSHMAEAQEWS